MLVRSQEGLVKMKLNKRDFYDLLVWTFGPTAGIEVLELLRIIQKANPEGPHISEAIKIAKLWASGLRSLGQIQQQRSLIGRSSPYYKLFYFRPRPYLRKLIK